jgi:patatin-like phospholipase/acyl hydrolase
LTSDSATQTEVDITTPPRLLADTTSVASSQGDDHTGKSWATIVNDPWQPLILCLDGGGIRGYSSLLILKRLMGEITRWERIFEAMERPSTERRTFNEDELLPCHYFDFMYGTSTGGLIATMLGRLRMTVTVCLDTYKVVGNELFGKKRSSIPLATKYDHEPLEKAVCKTGNTTQFLSLQGSLNLKYLLSRFLTGNFKSC